MAKLIVITIVACLFVAAAPLPAQTAAAPLVADASGDALNIANNPPGPPIALPERL